MIPYSRHYVDEADIASVVEVLRSDFLTTGPRIESFEQSIAEFCNAKHAVAVSSGTAALHAAMFALRIGPGDEVIVPSLTFLATANAVRYQGGAPIFADVLPDTLCLDAESVASKITERTRAIVTVDYAGQPADYTAISELALRHGLRVVADAAHSIGAEYMGRSVGTLADLTTFSFHPVKHLTTTEGGMVVTNDAELAARARKFRNHGVGSDHRERTRLGTHAYEMGELGYNYKLSDVACALGQSQLQKLPGFLEKRRAIAAHYDELFAHAKRIEPLVHKADRTHSYHLYVVRLPPDTRDEAYRILRAEGIGVNVHYQPVHTQPYYRGLPGGENVHCQTAEKAYQGILSLPIFPTLSESDCQRIGETLLRIVP